MFNDKDNKKNFERMTFYLIFLLLLYRIIIELQTTFIFVELKFFFKNSKTNVIPL